MKKVSGSGFRLFRRLVRFRFSFLHVRFQVSDLVSGSPRSGSGFHVKVAAGGWVQVCFTAGVRFCLYGGFVRLLQAFRSVSGFCFRGRFQVSHLQEEVQVTGFRCLGFTVQGFGRWVTRGQVTGSGSPEAVSPQFRPPRSDSVQAGRLQARQVSGFTSLPEVSEVTRGLQR